MRQMNASIEKTSLSQPITNITQAEFSSILLEEYKTRASRTLSGTYIVRLIEAEKTIAGFKVLYRIDGPNVWDVYTKYKTIHDVESSVKKEIQNTLGSNFIVKSVSISRGSVLLGVDVAVIGAVCNITTAITAVINVGISIYDHIEEKKCFVATAVYGSSKAYEVILFRRFRDQILSNSRLGCWFISWYYCNGMNMATLVAKNPLLKHIAKMGLNCLANSLKKWYTFKDSS